MVVCILVNQLIKMWETLMKLLQGVIHDIWGDLHVLDYNYNCSCVFVCGTSYAVIGLTDKCT